ncbi:unnamed protein product [Phytophthora fragariaefolia]|uniref:Unnamed protein product n=1 Tax=Phytophthora fragariaefolia TaxID=1490495 RepID=A0A9W6XS10_9STRA|nr:unnamed protein product [Phytophthora fragariaefolia]
MGSEVSGSCVTTTAAREVVAESSSNTAADECSDDRLGVGRYGERGGEKTAGQRTWGCFQKRFSVRVPEQLTSTPARDERHDDSHVVRGGQRTMPRSLRSVRAMTRRPDDDDYGSSSSSSDASGDDGSGSSGEKSSSSDDEHSDDEVGGRRGRHERRHRDRRRVSAKKSVKYLELPTFEPSPKMSVSTWMDGVDLALMNRVAKLDKSAAEWRVNVRRMMPGETYADFAAGLRDVVGRNKVSERVLLAQFYRWLDKTTKKLVKQAPKPTTHEDTVDIATEIDDPMDNVAQGMMNIGLPWRTAPSPYLIPMAGTTGQTIVVPGIGGTGLPSTITGTAQTLTSDGTVTQGEPKMAERKRNTAVYSGKAAAKPATKAKTKRESVGSSDDEPDAKPKKKRFKAAVKQVTSGDNTGTRSSRNVQRGGQDDNVRRDGRACYQCGQSGHWATQCPNGAKCFACNQTGHYARACPDAEAKAHNDAYQQSREQQPKPSAGNKER